MRPDGGQRDKSVHALEAGTTVRKENYGPQIAPCGSPIFGQRGCRCGLFSLHGPLYSDRRRVFSGFTVPYFRTHIHLAIGYVFGGGFGKGLWLLRARLAPSARFGPRSHQSSVAGRTDLPHSPHDWGEASGAVCANRDDAGLGQLTEVFINLRHKHRFVSPVIACGHPPHGLSLCAARGNGGISHDVCGLTATFQPRRCPLYTRDQRSSRGYILRAVRRTSLSPESQSQRKGQYNHFSKPIAGAVLK